MRLLFSLVLPAVLPLLAGVAFSQQLPSIRFNGDAAKPAFELHGWDGGSASSSGEALAEQWRAAFAVFVDHGEGNGQLPPLGGSYRIEGSTLLFEPRYPLQPGLTYRAVFDPGARASAAGEALSKTFAIPREDDGPRTHVEQVYPTVEILPENQLKLYVHFSAPMSRGEAYRRATLLDAAGKPIEFPFLELQQELWDPEGKRLTLLFDPGRVKRDLLPNREVGSPLREGESYTLVVDPGWIDATGRPLKEGFRKSFSVGPPDYETPSEKTWRVTPPKAGGGDPLTIEFPEPMDQALLVRVIHVTTPTGEQIPGSISVDRHETRWQFFPASAWKAGDYLIDAPTFLEDLAGNSLDRPFEVDVFEKVEEKVTRVSRTVRFTVAP